MKRITDTIGTGMMGGGVKEKDQVDDKFVEPGRHNVLFDNPQESGTIAAEWLKEVVWPTFLQEEVERSRESLPSSNRLQEGFSQRVKRVRLREKLLKL